MKVKGSVSYSRISFGGGGGGGSGSGGGGSGSGGDGGSGGGGRGGDDDGALFQESFESKDLNFDKNPSAQQKYNRSNKHNNSSYNSNNNNNKNNNNSWMARKDNWIMLSPEAFAEMQKVQTGKSKSKQSQSELLRSKKNKSGMRLKKSAKNKTVEFEKGEMDERGGKRRGERVVVIEKKRPILGMAIVGGADMEVKLPTVAEIQVCG